MAPEDPVDDVRTTEAPGEGVANEDAEREKLLKTYPVLAYFQYSHLPTRLRIVSAPFADVAWDMAADLTPGPEVAAGLRKLLEAKDCFVRAALP